MPYIPSCEEEKYFLNKYDPNKYPKPCVTVDIIVHTDFDSKAFNYLTSKILLIKRKNFPYKDCWALPGGFLDVGKENTLQAAVRELEEETSLKIESNRFKLLGVYSNPDRDPRDHVVDIVYHVGLTSDESIVAKANDDAKSVEFIDSDVIVKLIKSSDSKSKFAFDHTTILTDYFIKRKEEVDNAIAFSKLKSIDLILNS